MSDNKDELLPIVNEDGNCIGSMTREKAHDGSKILHPVVHLHVLNARKQLYLQKRPEWKDIQPGKWDTACGGHIDFGEDLHSALAREAKEELGITGYIPKFIKSYIFESSKEKELVNVFMTEFYGEISPSEELDGGRFWDLQEINKMMGKNVFTPNFENEFKEVVFPQISAMR